MLRHIINVTTSAKTLVEDFRATRLNVATLAEKIIPIKAMLRHQQVNYKKCRDIRAKM